MDNNNTVRNTQKELQKETRKNANKAGTGIIIYNLIMTAAVFTDLIIQFLLEAFKNPEFMNQSDEVFDSFINKAVEQAGSTIGGCILGLMFLFVYYFKSGTHRRIFTSSGKYMGIKNFLQILFVFMGTQFIVSVFSEGMEAVLNRFGYSASAAVETASGMSTTPSMFLYASFIGPIIEELVYRGFILRSLQKNGKLMAIAASAILFGFMHMNIYQILFAIPVGLIFGYVAVEYSIKWTIALHIFNNFIMGDLLSFFTSKFTEPVETGIIWIIEIIFFLGALYILAKNRKSIMEYIENNMDKEHGLQYALTSLSFILFIIVTTYISLGGIEKWYPKNG